MSVNKKRIVNVSIIDHCDSSEVILFITRDAFEFKMFCFCVDFCDFCEQYPTMADTKFLIVKREDYENCVP